MQRVLRTWLHFIAILASIFLFIMCFGYISSLLFTILPFSFIKVRPIQLTMNNDSQLGTTTLLTPAQLPIWLVFNDYHVIMYQHLNQSTKFDISKTSNNEKPGFWNTKWKKKTANPRLQNGILKCHNQLNTTTISHYQCIKKQHHIQKCIRKCT